MAFGAAALAYWTNHLVKVDAPMYRPACLISQTGVRSTCSPRAQRTRISLSPGLGLAYLDVTISSVCSVVLLMMEG